MEEDGGAANVEPFVARARARMGTVNGSDSAAGGVGAGSSNAGSGAKLPQVMQEGFGEAKGILEHNRMLIHEISQNKESSEADELSRNVALIRELDANVARAVDLYGDLSRRFARALAAKKAADAAAAGQRGDPRGLPPPVPPAAAAAAAAVIDGVSSSRGNSGF